jgi:O-antigen ligase
MRRFLAHYIELWTSAGIITLALTLFLMPFPRSWSLYSLGGFLFFGLILWGSDFNKQYYNLKKNLIIIIIPICYFTLNLLSILFREPKWTYIEGNLMFILIPIFGFPIFSSQQLSKRIIMIFKFFLAGILIICLYELIYAGWSSITFNNGVFSFNPKIDRAVAAESFDFLSSTSYFRSGVLSFIEHPIYFSILILFGIVLIAEFRKEMKINLFAFISVEIFLIVFIYLLSSRIGYLILVAIIVYWSYKILSFLKLRWIIFFIIAIIFVAAFKISLLNPRIKSKNELLLKSLQACNSATMTIDPRLIAWSSSLDLIKQNPLFGVGPGVREILAKKYLEKGYKVAASLRLNSHNQYIETQLTLGIPGTIILFLMVFVPLLTRTRLRFPVLVIPFLLIIVISMMFESILVRQWGIMFFVLFYCILLIPEMKSSAT